MAVRPDALGRRKPDPAGAHELTHTVRANELLERLDLLGTADELEHDRVAADVGDARTGHLAEGDQICPAVGRRRRR